MKITSAKRARQRFPDGTSSRLVVLTFEQDGEVVFKRVQISSCAEAVSNDLRIEARRLVVKAAREAVRDFAYMKHGDDWKKHVEWGRFFSGDLTPEEHEIVDQAIELLKEGRQ